MPVAAFGMCFGYPGAFIFGFSSFVIPLSEQYGWGRGEIALAITVSNISMMAMLPILGTIVDQKGVRALLIPATILFGLIFALFSQVSHLWQFYVGAFALTVLGGGASTIAYVPLLTSWFDKHKGLALGLGISGAGIGAIIMPRLVNWITVQASWREAYMAIGAVNLLIVAPLVFFMVRNKPSDLGQYPDGVTQEEWRSSGEARVTAGYTFSECLRQATFWKLVFASFLLGIALTGAVSQIVPLLVDRGMTRGEAAGAASMLGVSIITSRIISGYLMDKFHAPYVAAVALMTTAAGFASLAFAPSNATAIMTTVAIGIGLGVEFDVLGYLCAQYFGRRSVGRTYGFMYMLFNVGGAVGVYFAGLSFDVFGSYHSGLIVASMATLVAIGLLLLIGPYPTLPRKEIEPSPDERSAA